MMKYDIKALTLEEKLKLLCGKDRWHTETANDKLKSVLMQDGPSGLRKIYGNNQKEPATAMPTLSVLSNTWNVEMAKLDGATIADECVEKGVDIILAPGVNVKRTPLCGRNFEYFSEDPYLAGVMGREFIKGAQEKGIGTSLKHYCLNNSEYDRNFQSSEADERTMREIYLKAFEIACEAKPWTVMCSYNPVNGIYASQNKWILKDILRDEFGFDGVIVSDWGAVHSPYKAVKATLDLEMPYNQNSYQNLKNAYDKGLLLDEEIDFCVQNILNLIEKSENKLKKVELTKEQRHQNAVKIAEEGIVLLKNDGALPIKSGKYFIAGEDAENPTIGGGGSSLVTTDYKQVSLCKQLNETLKDKASFELTDIVIGQRGFWNLRGIYSRAYSYDGIILALAPPRQTEGADCDTIRLSKYYEEIINQTSKYNKNVIVLLYANSAVDMSAWIDKVNAVIYVGYAGEGVNEALTNIITGKISPSGKLSETFPIHLEDSYAGTNEGSDCVEWYREGLFVGYRYYDKKELDVLFPFGHGLSYANFEYSNLKIIKNSETDYELNYDITNNGEYDAKEVSQIYVKHICPIALRPEKELKSFRKDLIKAGQTKTVTVKLDKNAFAYYSIPLKDWYVENGNYDILVGASSRDIRLECKININLPDEAQQTLSPFVVLVDKSM